MMTTSRRLGQPRRQNKMPTSKCRLEIGGRRAGAQKALLVAGVTIGMATLMAWSLRVFGARSAWFALVVVLLPLAWFALLGRILVLQRPVLRLSAHVHALRAVERDERIYELVGVRVAKRLLRRSPLAVGAPDLHLPAEPTPANLAVLDERMRQAEALHEILLVVTQPSAAGGTPRAGPCSSTSSSTATRRCCSDTTAPC